MQFSVYLEKSDRSVIIIDRFTSHINAVAFQKHTNNLLVEENKIKNRKKMGKKTPHQTKHMWLLICTRHTQDKSETKVIILLTEDKGEMGREDSRIGMVGGTGQDTSLRTCF